MSVASSNDFTRWNPFASSCSLSGAARLGDIAGLPFGTWSLLFSAHATCPACAFSGRSEIPGNPGCGTWMSVLLRVAAVMILKATQPVS